MRQILVLIAAFLAVSARSLETYTFEQYLKEFNLQYSASELPTRKALFEAEVSRINAHNSKNLSWKEGVSKFSAMSAAEKSAFLGRSKGVHTAGKKVLKSSELPITMKPISALPKSVDWRTTGIVSAVKDQGHCGSCWAFASTSVIESHVAKETGLLFDLSVQQMAMCAPNPDECGGTGGCAGATSEIGFDYVTKSKGLYQEYQYSYASYYGKNYDCAIPSTGAPVATINGYVYLPENNQTALMNAVAQVGPIAISVDASTFSAYKSGIFNGCNQKQPDINHAVVLVGYGSDNGQDYWLVRNSWSPAWGEQGYIRLARFSNEEEMCGTDITPHDGSACKGQDDPVTVCGTCGILYDNSYPLNAALSV